MAGITGLGCGGPNLRSVRGALAAAERALDAGDARALFQVIDRRARDALWSVVKDRGRAARVLRADYPEPERSAGLAALGDALDVNDPAELFAKRCPAGCLAELARRLGAPVSEQAIGPELEVRTARGGVIRLYRDPEGFFGIVWNTPALMQERSRAARELIQIRENGAIYRKRRALESEGTR